MAFSSAISEAGAKSPTPPQLVGEGICPKKELYLKIDLA